MGSPISSLVAKLVLQELEKVAFHHYEPAFWRRYVDDTFVIIERSRLADFQDLLNGIFPDIQFTKEEEHTEQLPFPDVLVTRTPNGELNITVYRKATNTTQILNHHNNHPMAHKSSCKNALQWATGTSTRTSASSGPTGKEWIPEQLRQPLPPHTPTENKRRRAANILAPSTIYKERVRSDGTYRWRARREYRSPSDSDHAQQNHASEGSTRRGRTIGCRLSDPMSGPPSPLHRTDRTTT
ncbi:hypothetical protein SprV_0200583000 [Sparganum proliferum]